MVGMLAVSRAGHDKKNIYVIAGEEEEYVYLVDGRIRTADKPKKKNKKHIQVIKKVRMENGKEPFSDAEIRKTITQYQNSLRNKE